MIAFHTVVAAASLQWFLCRMAVLPHSSHSFSLIVRPRRIQSALHMCQLLGMNCAAPTDFSFSLQGFCKRGGETDIHDDGWGLAFYEGAGLRQFHDIEPASTSALAQFLSHQYPIRTLNMMAHIRYATVGSNDNLANVHPFSRELWGIQWTFCHNGQVPMFEQAPPQFDKNSTFSQSIRYYAPVGSTDSEAVFCAILNVLRTKFQTLPSLPVLYDTLQQLCQEVVDYDPQHTILNFLMGCGPHVLWAYSWPGKRPGSQVWNGLHYTVREYPFGKCHLKDVDFEVDFSLVTKRDDRVAVVATAPLTTDEEWVEFEKGQLLLFDEGLPLSAPQELFRVELQGHGLNSTVIPPPRLEEDLKRYEKVDEFFIGGGI